MKDWFRKILGSGPTAPAPAAPAPPPVPRVDLDDERLPANARAAARGIAETIDRLVRQADSSAFDRIVLSELVQLRDEHLPKLLRSYIDVPAEHRKEIFKKTGRSASFVLDEALAKMRARVDALSRDLAQSELDAFANNAEFVTRRYGKIEDPFG
ncbi:hypothetical protein [Novosphingobium sp.]|uniref:hypothetical protein n=1 Tax=Novosphingobium sp. TaxID=1874826 RepID=UPI0025DB53F7|nr:hypothetical protein [Novosphingobium sp.]MCC6926717.1 hypothetical protein [Novosphingobium sp.]